MSSVSGLEGKDSFAPVPVSLQERRWEPEKRGKDVTDCLLN